MPPSVYDAVSRFRKTVLPPLVASSLHKGQSGRIGVVGGSCEYTGAPFYAAMAALRTGVDLCHVFCAQEASVVIKMYAPELVVHPYLCTTTDLAHLSPTATEAKIQSIVDRMEPFFSRLDALVVGPGLSRDAIMVQTASRLIQLATKMHLPLIFDADGLFVVQQNLDLIRGYTNAVLTPNLNEFKRLCEAASIDPGLGREASAMQLSRYLGMVTILNKGETDIITDGDKTMECSRDGSPRRCGGQGDILSGTLAAFLAWRNRYQQTKTPASTLATVDCDDNAASDLPVASSLSMSAYFAADLVRLSARMAFQQHGRAMVASDILREVGPAFKELFDYNL